jgi:Tfp pilus tip-associated adhesin PilY1
MVKIIIKTLFLGCFIFISSVCYGDEQDIFTVNGKTDALIILDLSGSMNWSPSGWGCSSPGCRKDIAAAAIKAMLDSNGDGTIDQNDEDSLGVRIGYMRFPGLIPLRNEIGSSYSDIWSSVLADTTPFLWGGTPLVTTMGNAKDYLDSRRSTDPYSSCFQQFVILITDGQDTYICNGSGTGPAITQYKRRKASVAKAKALADAGYKVFVIGFGNGKQSVDMSDPAWGNYVDMNTLNWMAYYGGTDNPNEENVGNTGAITIPDDPCEIPTTNDPTLANLSGYAFLAENGAELNAALKATMGAIVAAKYSFSQASVTATRVQDQNYMFIPSFLPSANDPFWRGYLKRYPINSDGSLPANPDWDAGDLLSKKQASNRNILTYVGGSWTIFLPPPDGPGWGQWQGYLGVGNDTNRAKAIMQYIGGDPVSNPDGWKLGDTFHSNPIVIGSPSAYFNDFFSPDAFSTFRTQKQNREKIVVVGANDGQFRAFSASSGDEKWSFIPPNLLPKLQYLAHSSNSGTLPTHMYFVDGPVTGADVWWGADGSKKVSSDWRTLLIFSEGRGVRNSANTQASYLWSSSKYCDGNFNYKYDSTHPYYCGYWAFDVTDTSATTPTLKWRLNPSATQAPYLDEPWSKMAIGRAKINGNEKWVGFIGAGYNNDGDPNRGKGFFVVDLSSGNIIWSFTRGGSDTATTSTSMTYSIPGSAAIVDTDNDGFVDTAYIGDLGGNVWRFKFCTGADGNACGTSDWSGGRLFQSTTATPVYTTPSVSRGAGSIIWVFWGTGNKENPMATTTQDSFFAVKDSDRTSTYTLGQLENITGSVFSNASPGWYISLASGEKVLSDSAAFGGMITWTTYTPPGSGSSCLAAGTPQLYALGIMPVVIGGLTYQVGAGLFATSTGNVAGTRSLALGRGIAQVPIFSEKPGGTGGTDAYISTSGGGGVDASLVTSAGMADSPFTKRLKMIAPSAQVLHWWDQRMH